MSIISSYIISDNTISALIGAAVALIITHLLRHLGRVILEIDTYKIDFVSTPGTVGIYIRARVFNYSEMHRVLKNIRVLIKGKEIKTHISAAESLKYLYLPPRNYTKTAFGFTLKDKAIIEKINLCGATVFFKADRLKVGWIKRSIGEIKKDFLSQMPT